MTQEKLLEKFLELMSVLDGINENSLSKYEQQLFTSEIKRNNITFDNIDVYGIPQYKLI